MSIPKYAQSVPPDRLVRFLCKGRCGTIRYGKVSKAPWSKDGSLMDSDLHVTCLRCGRKQSDNYNWIRI